MGEWEGSTWHKWPTQGLPLTSLVSVLNFRFWMVLLAWMLFSNFIICF